MTSHHLLLHHSRLWREHVVLHVLPSEDVQDVLDETVDIDLRHTRQHLEQAEGLLPADGLRLLRRLSLDAVVERTSDGLSVDGLPEILAAWA